MTLVESHSGLFVCKMREGTLVALTGGGLLWSSRLDRARSFNQHQATRLALSKGGYTREALPLS